MRRAWFGCLFVVLLAFEIGCENNVTLLQNDSGVLHDMAHSAASNDLAGADLFSDGTKGPLPPPSGPETGAFADFATKLAAAICLREERCGFVGVSEDAVCRAAQLTTVTSPPSYSVDDAINAKRATLDAQAAQTCLTAIGAAGCGARDSYVIQTGCDGYLKGTVANGAGCRSSVECTNGFCAAVAEGCAGTCKAFATAGFSCANALCDAASFCDTTKNVCVALGGSGSGCGAAQPCQSGLVCHGEQPDGTGGTCGNVTKSGAACTYSADCDVGLYCDRGTSKCTARVASGGTCNAFDACQSPLDCNGLVYPNGADVGKNGTCGAWSDIGKACAPTANGVTSCPYDSTCNSSSKVCTVIGTEGYACTSANDCRPALYCNTAGMCAKEVSYGSVCDPNDTAFDQCLSGSCDPTSNACLTFCG